MSYLDKRMTREEFISTRGATETQHQARNALRLLDYFCKAVHNKDGDEVVLELESVCKTDQNYDRLFRFCNSYVLWLQEEHPDIAISKNRYETHLKSHQPSTIKGIINYLRAYCEEFGQIEFSERRFKRMVKLPKIIHEEPDPFTKEQIRIFVEMATPKRRALYMTLKDSGMRIGEAHKLRKKDIDMTTNPVTITIQAKNTKTKRGRTTFITRETKSYLKMVLDKIDDKDLVFGSSTNARRALSTELQIVDRIRKRTGLTQRYDASGRFKKNLHSLRAYCATQLAEVYDEGFAHAFIGHKGYLQQYIRNKDKLAEKYLRAENHLMVYQTVEVVENSITTEMIEERVREEMKKQFAQLHQLEVRREQLLTS